MEQSTRQTNKIADELSDEHLAIMFESKGPNEREKDEGWPIVTLADIKAKKIEENPVIKGLLHEGDPTVIHAEGGVGKSIIAQDIAMALGCGLQSLWGIFPIPAPRASIFIQSENTFSAINQRVKKKCEGNPEYITGLSNIAFPHLHENIIASGYMEDRKFRKQIIDFTKKVEDQTQLKVGLLVFDPLISFHNEQENENVAMRKTLDHIQNDIAVRINVTPIVIHHDNRHGEFRGASAIRDWARNMIKLQGYPHKGQKRIRLIHEKCNNYEMFESFVLQMDEHLNFMPLDDFELMPAKKRKRCGQVREALVMLGRRAESKKQLAAQYEEVSGVTTKTTQYSHISEAAESDFIKHEEYKDGHLVKNRYYLPSE